jgi:hypothetical protein
MVNRDDHWESVYATKRSTDVSWYQPEPTTSLRLINDVARGPDAGIVDIGGGASLLVDHLIAEGFIDLTVVDLAGHALDAVRDRLGEKAGRVTFIRHDVPTWNPNRRYDIWHDRAVFHFLTEPTDRERYVDVARRALHDNGVAIVGTFAEDGPTHCSGLPVSRYSPEDLAAAFAPTFVPIRHEREEHVTPAGAVQPFTWMVFRRS